MKISRVKKTVVILSTVLILTSCNLPFVGNKNNKNPEPENTKVATETNQSVDDGDVLRPTGTVKPGAKTIIFMKDNEDYRNDYTENGEKDSENNEDTENNVENTESGEESKDKGAEDTQEVNAYQNNKDKKATKQSESDKKVEKPAPNNAGVSAEAGQSGADPQSILQKAQEEDNGNPLTAKKDKK